MKRDIDPELKLFQITSLLLGASSKITALRSVKYVPQDDDVEEIL